MQNSGYILCLLGLSLTVISSAFAQDQEPEKKDEAVAVDLITQRGLHVRCPYFSRDLTVIDPDLRDHITSDYSEVLQEVNKAVQELLYNPPGLLGVFRYLGLAKDFVSLLARQDAQRSKLCKPLPKGPEVSRNLKSFYIRVLDGARVAEDKHTGTSVDETSRNMDIFIESMIESVKASPVATLWSWNEATINEQSMESYLADLIGQLRHQGLGTLITLIQTFMKL